MKIIFVGGGTAGHVSPNIAIIHELKKISENIILPEDLSKDGWWKKRPHESLEEARERGYRVIEFIKKKHAGTDDRIILVSHNAFYACFMSALLKLSSPDDYWFVLNNTGVTRIDFLDKYIYLVYQNDVSHLLQKEIT